MLIIDRSVITDGGAALLNSGDPINITSVKTGSGTYTSSEDIKSRTALKSTQYSYTPSSVTVDGATRSIDALLSNYDPDTETAIVTSDYTLTEVGLFATVNGADVLFAIGVSYDGSEVPAFTGQNKSEIIVNWDMAVSGTDAITITATGAPALATDLNAHVNSEAYSASGVHGLRVVLDDTDLVLQAYVNGDWEDVSGGGPKTATITLSADTVTVDDNTSTATVTFTTNSDGTPSVSSSDDNIATASVSGTTVTITGVDTGSATVTVSIPATAKYTAVSATISVTSSVAPIPELVIGNTYYFGGFNWTAAEDLGNNTVCLQSQGMTGGTWPGYKLASDYSGTKSYGSANAYYNGNIGGDNIANYDNVTQTWYTKYSAAEKTGQAYGSGLFIVGKDKCGYTAEGQPGSGNYYDAMKIAGNNHASFGATYNEVYLGDVAFNGQGCLFVDPSGNNIRVDQSQADSCVVAPAFNLDLTKVKLADSSWIILKNENIPTVYGALWDGTSTTALSRTDAAATFTDPVPAVNNGDGSSPFDTISPWKDIKRVEDANAGTLVEIPKFYYKWTVSGATLKLQVSDGQFPGSHVAPAFMDRGDGQGERDKVYVGAYHCATSTYKSTTGVKPMVNATRGSFRSSISGLGTGIYQWDYAILTTIRMLYLVEYADWNSQAKIGYGCGNNSSTENAGITDSMTYHTGTNAANRTTYGHVRYRYIEDLWANVVDFCDGIYFNGTDIYVIKNPANFSDSAGGTKVGTRLAPNPYSGSISAWAQSSVSGYDWFMYASAISGSDSTYITDTCSYMPTGTTLSTGGYYAQNQAFGLFMLGGDVATNGAYAYYGSRLMKL